MANVICCAVHKELDGLNNTVNRRRELSQNFCRLQIFIIDVFFFLIKPILNAFFYVIREHGFTILPVIRKTETSNTIVTASSGAIINNYNHENWIFTSSGVPRGELRGYIPPMSLKLQYLRVI